MKKKIVFTMITVVLLVAVVLGIAMIRNIKEKNTERADHILENLAGMTFTGEKRTNETVDKGGAIKLAAHTVTRIECEFQNEGTIRMITTESYFSGLGITINGELQYDDVKSKEKICEIKYIDISLSGVIQMKVDSKICNVYVDENDNPQSIVIDGILCNAK